MKQARTFRAGRLAPGPVQRAARIFDKAQVSYENAYKRNKTNPLIISGGTNAALESHNLDLAKSADLNEVRALYQAAGLSLTKDLLTLNSAPRVKASPDAEAYLVKNISFNGGISVPVLTMHTTGDGLVVPENEQAYRSAVDRAGRGNLLRQVFVHRAGHCAFTPAETVTAVQTLENRLATGRWHVPSPAALNKQAGNLGPLNVFSTGGPPTPTAPAFISYSPARYLRPFNLFPPFR